MTNRRVAPLIFCIALAVTTSSATAAPFDFLKRIGNAFAHPRHSAAPAKSPRKSAKRSDASAQPSPSPEQDMAATKGGQTGAQAATPTASPMPERRAATTAGAQPLRADLPYGVPVPNRAGFVFSPFSPNGGYVDVRGFPSGTAVKDPYTGKLFLTP